jgi:membrane-associated phospholipid phosphatase
MPGDSSSETREPLLAFPGWAHLGETVVLALAFTVWFWAIYGTADYLTGLRSQRVRIHLDAELAIPLVPASVLFYMSIYPLFWLAPFVLRDRRELRAFVASMALVALGGGIGFLLFPSESAFPPCSVPWPWDGIYAWADWMNLRYNMVPSLHVALAILCVDVFARRAGLAGGLFFWSWGLAVAASTVLTHFHHVVDVVTGLALGLAVSRLVYPRWAVRQDPAALAR